MGGLIEGLLRVRGLFGDAALNTFHQDAPDAAQCLVNRVGRTAQLCGESFATFTGSVALLNQVTVFRSQLGQARVSLSSETLLRAQVVDQAEM